MPFYLITVKLKRSAVVETIREFGDRDLERIYQKLYYACEKKYESKLEYFDCVMISKRSKRAAQFKKDQAKRLALFGGLPERIYTQPKGKRPGGAPSTTLVERARNNNDK